MNPLKILFLLSANHHLCLTGCWNRVEMNDIASLLRRE